MPEKPGLSSTGFLCCPLFKALTLDPLPVIGGRVYIPGAEGFRLSDLNEELVKHCPAHRFSFGQLARTLSRCASKDKPCSCDSVPRNVAPFVPNAAGGGSGYIKTLWAFEMDNLVTAYSWLMRNRSLQYHKGCNAVLVYQLRKSNSLPPGLYVYKSPPSHFGCTVDRPLAVVEQFNFGVHPIDFGGGNVVPSTITIDVFPGHDNLSVMYVINRNLAVCPWEYGNRMFGEARALELTEPCATPTAIAYRACEHHEVAMRTDGVCVIDLRWKGFATTTACINAIPKLGGLRALVWSNHSNNVQDIECNVLAWLFGRANELPNEVQMVDHSHEPYGVRYVLMDMDKFHEELPEPPSGTESFFVHACFTGNENLASSTIGLMPVHRSRMGSPSPGSLAFRYWYSLPGLGCYQPTPFSCGVRHARAWAFTDVLKMSLVEWALKQDASNCEGDAVQHTLYYHARDMKYRMMVSHTVRHNDASLNIFRL